jgi:transcriptional regulator with XRE-family HTH domain
MENLEAEAIRLIKLKLKEKGWNSSVLASKIGMHPSSVAKMLASDQIKLDRLKQISELLGYNFLRALADRIDVNDNPPKYTLEAATKERLRELEIENATLLKVLGK